MASQPLSPSRLHRLALGTVFGVTDPGLVRTSNEDNFLIDEELNLVMVADGMGGHEAGEVASAAALSSVRENLHQTSSKLHATWHRLKLDGTSFEKQLNLSSQDPDATWEDKSTPAVGAVFDAVEFANDQIHAANLARSAGDGRGMGTTLTGVWHPEPDGTMILFHVGDSRLYLLRGGVLKQVSRDQTLYQQAIDAGQFEHLPARNMLLQAIGPVSPIKPEIRLLQVQPGDVCMLCSDGLHGAVAHAEIESIMTSAPDIGLEEGCKRLVSAAIADGGKDNITVVLIHVGE